MGSAPAGAGGDSSTLQVDGQQDKAAGSLVTVYIMGKAYEVPAEATIMGAIEYAGHQIIRGAGCREGYCGACATIYRLPGDYKIRTGLACMTMVEEGMTLAQIPSVPAEKAIYDIEKLKPNVSAIQQMYSAQPDRAHGATGYAEKVTGFEDHLDLRVLHDLQLALSERYTI